jgi:hypothetical protein
MEVDVHISGDTVKVGAAQEVFTKVSVTGGYPSDVSADGQRALVAAPVEKPRGGHACPELVSGAEESAPLPQPAQ